ncbi:hypothetical protein EXIGLDRAFT_706435 [Exidia glandulosa HHB12029]|uniref:Uncharacterized protein n=1 Tax=Exidia glandulosa HHB12029 TaxID=1314781 RepID=A0A165K624_EXIGL|nr:hypothetical protein EXIGLDRAFT_706435 [Exidia glandulosa HHB12029]
MLFSRLAIAAATAALASAHIIGITASTSNKHAGRYARTFRGRKNNFRLTFQTAAANSTYDYSVVVGLSNSTSTEDSDSSIGTAVDVIDLAAVGRSYTSGKNFSITVPIPNSFYGKEKRMSDSEGGDYTVTAAVTTSSGRDGATKLDFFTTTLSLNGTQA